VPISELNHFKRKPWYYKLINTVRITISLICLIEILLIKYFFKTDFGWSLIGQVCFNSSIIFVSTFVFFILKENNKVITRKNWRVVYSWLLIMVFSFFFFSSSSSLINNIFDSYKGPIIRTIEVQHTHYVYKGMSEVTTDMGKYKLAGNINKLQVGNHYSFALFEHSNFIVLVEEQ
jgi:membrane protein YdbS with pleckstrin-like domain